MLRTYAARMRRSCTTPHRIDGARPDPCKAACEHDLHYVNICASPSERRPARQRRIARENRASGSMRVRALLAGMRWARVLSHALWGGLTNGMGRMNDARSECPRVWLRALARAFGVVPACGLLAAAVSCGGSDKTGVGSSKLPQGAHSEVLDHEDCADSGHRVELLDTNGDG